MPSDPPFEDFQSVGVSIRDGAETAEAMRIQVENPLPCIACKDGAHGHVYGVHCSDFWNGLR